MDELPITPQDIVVAAVVSRLLVFWIINWDERRLTPERLERAWPPASKGAAILQFGEIALPIHILRTRRSLVGVVLAVVATYAVLKAVELSLMVTGHPFPTFP